ncbi:hypothetical protein QTS76_35290 [Micromonospora sp. b486]|nr:hypothetical protein [Micromonospora sp. b486]MDM4784423.1 hypothetical protein [Micromonospora sp. b486]
MADPARPARVAHTTSRPAGRRPSTTRTRSSTGRRSAWWCSRCGSRAWTPAGPTARSARRPGVCSPLRIGDKGFTVAGAVDHPGALADGGEWAPIRRSLVVDGVLWTVSDAGLKATACPA